MILEILRFIFDSFWTWLGTFLLVAAFRPLKGIVRVTRKTKVAEPKAPKP